MKRVVSGARLATPAPGQGYALLVVMAMAVLLLISLTAALPSVFQEDRREREAELIFRGTQYARAIALFHRQFQRFPTSMKELIQTNGMRFLRQEFKDPMDPKGKWRIIHANAAGVLIDSKTRGTPGNTQNPLGGQSGASQSSSGSDSSSSSSQSSSQSSSSSGFGSQSSSSSLGFSPQSGSQPGSSGFGLSQGSQSGSQSAFGGAASGNQIMGAFIVGVAATSHKESIRKYNNKTHYDEWEFLGVDLNLLGLGGGGIPGQGGTPGQNQGGAFGGQSGSSAFGGSNQGSPGFGSQPTGPGGSTSPSSPPSSTPPPQPPEQ